jgi:hypothetical protein
MAEDKEKEKTKWITIACVSLLGCLLAYFLGGTLETKVIVATPAHSFNTPVT